MTTTNKDFRVKNGIQVAGDATIGGSLTVATPTLDSHVATKSYVDGVALPLVSSTAPSSPSAGQLWLDSTSSRLHAFDGTDWIVMATMEDAAILQDHIHDTSIEGDGRITTIFIDGGTATSTYYWTTDAGTPSLTDWAETWSGGIAVDNFS